MLAACLVVTLAMAQPKNNSPYSRFGLGDLLNPNFTNLRATPGFSNAYSDAYHINLQNPASLGALQMAAFDFGLYGRNSNWESPTLSNDNWSGNLTHLALAFTLNNPINNLLEREKRDFSWGMSFAIMPYSLVGYTVETSGTVPDIGDIRSQFRGEGGTNQFTWGNGIRYKNFSAGLNISYLFGKISNIRSTIFEEIPASYQNRFTEDFSINGLNFKLGAQYNFIWDQDKVKKIKFLTLGVTAANNASLNTNSSQFIERFNPSYSIATDTVLITNGIEGNATLPGQFGAGAIFSYAGKLKVGANYDKTLWSNYKNDAKPEIFEDTWKASFGAEYIPDYASYNRFWKRVRYRVGGFVGKDPRTVDGEQLGEYGVTFGVGLPITLPRKQVSFINLSIELGKRGANTSLQESYGEFTLGFTLNDNSWFFKRKFN